MGVGQNFEEWFLNSAREQDIYTVRIKTRNSGFKGDNEIADFYLMYKGTLVYIETKTTQSNSFPLSMVRSNQGRGIHEASQYDHVEGGFVIEMRKHDRYFYLSIKQFAEQLRNGVISLPVTVLESIATEIYMEEDGYLDLLEAFSKEDKRKWKK